MGFVSRHSTDSSDFSFLPIDQSFFKIMLVFREGMVLKRSVFTIYI